MPSGSPVLVDTGPLVAIIDRGDGQHTRCVEALAEIRAPLITVWPVVTEAFHLLSFSFEAQEALWEFIERGVSVVELNASDAERMRWLMRKYRDRPMDVADAALVRVAERDGLSTVFTLDHADFRTYRPARGKAFAVIPARLG
ncbi:MAG: PIN domain-containing protein [Candidatus Rokubacteria bacterium]|nr:PIN domain-containing protein [Candidatus Rokubacteria bacterium]